MNSKEYLNKNVKVIIDRKMGSRHPKYGFIYLVNYGYLPNTISDDGKKLDCYVLGVFEAVNEFEGKCIAIIHRLNDNDDKLIVVPDSRKISNKEIEALTEFQERFFEHEIIRENIEFNSLIPEFISRLNEILRHDLTLSVGEPDNAAAKQGQELRSV